MTRTPLLILGMRDNRCRESVAHALATVAGVSEADVNLCRACATITHSAACTPADLMAAVVGAGYLALRVREPGAA